MPMLSNEGIGPITNPTSTVQTIVVVDIITISTMAIKEISFTLKMVVKMEDTVRTTLKEITLEGMYRTMDRIVDRKISNSRGISHFLPKDRESMDTPKRMEEDSMDRDRVHSVTTTTAMMDTSSRINEQIIIE